MIDRLAQARLVPWLDRAAQPLVACGVTANGLTLFGFLLGLVAAGLIATGHPLPALVPCSLDLRSRSKPTPSIKSARLPTRVRTSFCWTT